MGLTKQLKQDNTIEAHILSTATLPVTDGGYNVQNIPALANQAVQPITPIEIDNIRNATNMSAHETQHLYVPDHLQKPTVPVGGGFNQEISALIVEQMWRIVCERNLYNFYTTQSLQTLVNNACKHDWKIIQSRLGISTIEETVNNAAMGLYDIVFFIDDSGSMATKESTDDGMDRMQTARQIVSRIAFLATLMDADGVIARAFNDPSEGNGLSSVAQVDAYFNALMPSGGTPAGSRMRERIINTIVKPLLDRNELQRPILVFIVTDGEPSVSTQLGINEKFELEKVLNETKEMFKRSKYGEFGIAFSFVQVGTDKTATDYLSYLDEHPIFGSYVDCTASYYIENTKCTRKTGIPLSVGEYMTKLMIGAFDSRYDLKNENVTGFVPPPSYDDAIRTGKSF